MREISQRFTATGWIGIVCLLIGPAMCGYAYATMLTAAVRIAENPYSALYMGGGTWWMALLGGALSLVAFPLIVIGRVYEVRGADVLGSSGRRDPMMDRQPL